MEDEEEFTYATLRRVERQENTSPRLSRLTPRFWERMGEHLTRLRQAFQDQQEEDPTARRTVVLADELRNTQRLAESIWSLREKKVVQAALLATRKREGPAPGLENETPEERRIYAEVCRVLLDARDDAAITDPFSRRHAAANRPEALAPLAVAASSGAASTLLSPPPPSTVGPVGEATLDRDTRSGGAAGRGGDDSPAAWPQAQADEGRGGMGAPREHEVELRVVEALGDVPKFAGPDLMHYELAKGEIGNLPARAAELLEKRGVVRILPA